MEKVVIGIAKEFKVTQPQSKKFTLKVDLTPAAGKSSIDKLMNNGILDIEDEAHCM